MENQYKIQISDGRYKSNITHPQKQLAKMHQDLNAKKMNKDELQLLISLDCYSKCVGVLYTCWRRKNGKLIGVNFGTAFAVDSLHLITCTHNVYTNKTKTYATDIIFVPGITKGQIPDSINKPTFKATVLNRRINLEKVNFDLEPIKEELSILKLDKPFYPENQKFPKISKIKQNGLKPNQTYLGILGYPSKDKLQNHQLQKNTNWELQKLSGKFKSINRQKCQMHYAIKTVVGISGSPIFAFNQLSGLYQVVGIHTHSGRQPNTNINTGLYFSNEIIQQIYQIIPAIKKDSENDKNDHDQGVQYEKIQQKKQANDQPQQQQLQILKLLSQSKQNKKNQEVIPIQIQPYKKQQEKALKQQVQDLQINQLKEKSIDNIILPQILPPEIISDLPPVQETPQQYKKSIQQIQLEQKFKSQQQLLNEKNQIISIIEENNPLADSFNNSVIDCEVFDLFQNQYSFCDNSDIEPDIFNIFAFDSSPPNSNEEPGQKQRGKFQQMMSELTHAQCTIF